MQELQKDGSLYEWTGRSKKVSEVELDDPEQEIQQIHTYNDYDANILKTDLLKINISNTPTNNLKDFEAQVIINNHIGKVLVVTEAKVSACRVTQASKWVLTEEM